MPDQPTEYYVTYRYVGPEDQGYGATVFTADDPIRTADDMNKAVEALSQQYGGQSRVFILFMKELSS